MQAGKDVFVEKPASVYVDEGQKMVQAARKYNARRPGGHHAAFGRLLQEGRRDRSERPDRRSDVLPHVAERIGQQGALGEARGRTGSRGSRLGDVAGAGAARALQSKPLGRRGGEVPDVSIFLGLRGRRHDRLGCAPDRSRPSVFRRADAARRFRRWATSSTWTTTRKRQTR